MSKLSDLLRQLDTTDPALAKELRKEYDALTDRRAFGLNFERHVPEAVELPGRKVRRGDKVHLLPERGTNPGRANELLWRVAAIDRTATEPMATLEREGEEPIEFAVADLVVVAEFRDPIYPGMVSTGRIERGGDAPFHTVIKAENHHALQTLLFTHRGQVDCIYIDPPYNTGNEGWIYNDKYVAGDDIYKHSKWLAFMERRLLLAKELLRPTGVIIVAIGDDEHHRLRMLMDQVFDAQNFIANVTWQGLTKSDARYVGGGDDYMLIYAKSRVDLDATDRRWRDKKDGAETAIAEAQRCYEAAKGDGAQATKAYRAWLVKNLSVLGRGVEGYRTIDDEGRLFQGDNMASPTLRPNLRYDVLHPVTGRPVKTPPKGWQFAPALMDERIAAGLILFGRDETTIPTRKRFLADALAIEPAPVFQTDRRRASKHVAAVLGDKRFPYPKDHEVLARWLRMIGSTDAVVLDFFGGSGTTAEAVMRLNSEDGGTRRCILVTNNEVAAADAKKLRKDGHRPGDADWEAKGVYEYVAKPRIQTVATGTRPDGSTYSEGLEANVEFFDLTYEAPLRVSTNREFAKVAPLLWMRAGSRGRRIDALDHGWDVAEAYGVIADLDQSEAFLKAIATGGEAVEMAFIVTDEDRLFQTLGRELPDHVEPVRLYEAYLRNFEIESGRSNR